MAGSGESHPGDLRYLRPVTRCGDGYRKRSARRWGRPRVQPVPLGDNAARSGLSPGRGDELSTHRLRLAIGTTVAIVLSSATVVAYVAISGAINAQPPTPLYEGWIALLQRSGDPIPEHVQLRTEALQPGAPGDHPALRYEVVLCGDRSFDGVLLVGGDARLDDAHLTGYSGSGRIENLQRVVMTDVMSQGQSARTLENVQVIPISISASPLVPCSTSQAGEILGGGVNVVEGLAQRPIKQKVRYLGVEGARETLTWPLVGSWPGSPKNFLGNFEGLEGLSGSWMVPPTRQIHVDMGRLTTRGAIESAAPSVVDTSALAWTSVQSMQPSLVVSSVERSARLQQELALAAIGFGIGGSILAGLSLDWLRGRESDRRRIDSAGAMPMIDEGRTTSAAGVDPLRPTSTNRDPRRLVIATAVIAYALGRLGR